MSVRIRLRRVGRRHRPAYRVAAMDRRSARDSSFIEELGFYDPAHPNEDLRLLLKRDRIDYWLSVGAQPSDTVRDLLKKHDAKAGAATS